AWRQTRCQREPPLGRIVNQLQISPVELLEPPPPFNGLEVLFFGGELVAAQTNSIRLPAYTGRPEAAAGAPVKNCLMIGCFVNGHERTNLIDVITESIN